MKILFIACKYDYGKPELGFSFEYFNLYDALVKMDNKNNEVVYFPFDEIASQVGIEKMNERLLEVVEKEKPQLCLFFLFVEQIKKETVKKITEKGFLTMNWFADDLWRFYNFSRYWAPYFNWVSTDQPCRLKDYYKIGYKNVVIGGWACNHNIYKPLNLPKIYDVTFVGQPHGNRKKIVAQIKKAGIKIECFGRGWPNGKVSQKEMVKIFSQSKINLNFSKCSGRLTPRYFAQIFLRKEDRKIRLNNPKYWVPNLKSVLARRQKEIKGRIFEIPGCRGFLLTDYAPGLEKYYEIGKEIECFYDIKDLIEKIKYYLEHEEEREKIAFNGYKRTFRDHTYEKRFNEIFKIIGLIK